jgi:hypothetical protein
MLIFLINLQFHLYPINNKITIEKVENILREDAVQFLPDTEKYFSAEDIELFISEF